MKLDIVRDMLRRALRDVDIVINAVPLDPNLVEDILWFLDLLRKREGYDVERPVRRARQENPRDGDGMSYEEIRKIFEQYQTGWSSPFADMFRKQRQRGYEKDRWEEPPRPDPPPPPSGTPRPWHHVLGVPTSATLEERVKAYRTLAQRLHPDKPGGDTEKFQELQQAKREAGIE